MTTNEIKTDVLNRMVICDGQSRGRIRYVGPVYGTNNDSEIWYGIEWRDVSRGKHDGTYKGRQYFKTQHATSGSFVKPFKVDFGIDIWSAVEERYFGGKDELVKSDDQNQDQLLYNNFKVDQKASDLDRIGLARCRVSDVSSSVKLAAMFTNLRELDLEENLLGSWSQIFSLLNELKNLKILIVSNNSLELVPRTNQTVFSNIKTLVMNRMSYDWEQITKILEYFPEIVELKVCFNRIERIDSLEPNLVKNLRIIDLESNSIESWQSMRKLGQLKSLETLNANDTRIKEIVFDDCGCNETTSLFPQLRSLTLNQNLIDNWKSINELNKLKSLHELRMRSNPLNDSDRLENVRQLVIARIGGLKMFNRTPISGEERKGAEIDYMKKFGKEWLNRAANKDSFCREHPRYDRFVELYGAPEKGEYEVKPDILKSSLIALKIKNEETGQIIQRKIPSSIEIKRLKAMICNLFKSSAFDSDAMSLVYQAGKNPETSYELDNDYRTLSFYSIENDDIIIARKQL